MTAGTLDPFDIAGQAEEEAATASGKLNFGKLTIRPRFLAWQDGQPTEIDLSTYQTLDARKRSLEYNFQVDIQEFKPDLSFTYERKVGVGSLDWNKILKPSIEAVCGRGSTDKETLAATLRRLHGAYICAEDVPQTPTKSKPDRVKYNTIKLVTIFESREACHAAWQEKYGAAQTSGGNGAAAASADVPPGYTADSWKKQADDIKKLRLSYIQKGTPAADATRAAAEEYGATAAQVTALLGLKSVDEIPF